MNTKLTIKNFRVFDENGESFDLKPITILTGCNSSGKSSVVKALSLLCGYISLLKEDKANDKKVSLSSHDLDFSEKPNNLLGKLSKVVNRKSNSDTVSFCLRVHSLMLAQDVDVEFEFSVAEDSFDGVISAFRIKKTDGTIVFSSSKDCECKGDFNSIFPEFLHFVETQAYISTILSVGTEKVVGIGKESMSDEEFSNYREEFTNFVNEFKLKYGKNAILDYNRWNNLHRNYGSFLHKNSDNHPEMLAKVEETGILYYLPILDDKLSGTKEEALHYLDECITKSTEHNVLVSFLKRLKAAFIGSSCLDFMSFYKAMEDEYLSSFTKSYSFPSSGEKAPMLFHANNAMISVGIEFNMFNGAIQMSFTDDGELKDEGPIETDKEVAFTFPYVFAALASLSSVDDSYFDCPNGTDCWGYSSTAERLFFKFIEAAIEEIVVEDTPDALRYVSSSVINVKRLYPVESSDEFTVMLKRYLKAKRDMDREMNYVPGTFLNKWIGKDHFGIGQNISIEIDKEGLGITLRLHENENDKEGSLLADNGYGLTQLFAILLNIEIAIMERKRGLHSSDNKISIYPDTDVVYDSPTIAIEEPEIHLHPNFQAKLAELFAEAYKEYGINFIIETHSEYLIRKLQTLVLPAAKEKQINCESISIIYINDVDANKRSKGDPHVKHIGIRPNGFLDRNFGSGFFDQSLLNIKELQEQEN